MKVLTEQEKAALDSVTGLGGFFKVPGVGQRIMAAAINAPVTVMATAGEGGPWGMAILAAYMVNKQDESLNGYLENCAFSNAQCSTVIPDASDTAGFEAFIERYQAALEVEKAAALEYQH
jgi:sugar (pentulose or hexulose) kinase